MENKELEERVLDELLKEKENCPLQAYSRDGIREFYEDIRELLFFNAYHPKGDMEDAWRISERAKERFTSFAQKEMQNPPSFTAFYEELPKLKRLLDSDVVSIYEGDPACRSCMEVILAYPGFIAISAYRIAHLLFTMGLSFPARVISEYAHSRTGIDIHPGARIGPSFFIDHGTGIVIGETTIIGEGVKLYQGVTLGGISLKEGRALCGVKRHPTIEDRVTIYAGASILGGNTVIGHDSVIGSNVFLLESVPPFSLVRMKSGDLEVKERKK